MTIWKVKLSLFLNYFIFAILLNCVGTVILEVINHYQITKSQAGTLDAYKDITIAVFSFVVAAYLPRLGYKTSMLLGLALIGVACFLTPLINQMWMIRLLLVSVGVGIALMKVCVYSTIGLITKNEREHASFTSLLEGVFMVGVLSGYWIFGFFINSPRTSWLDAFWLIGALAALAFLLLASTRIDEQQIHSKQQSPKKDFIEMIGLIRFSLVITFVISIFAYVFIEQGISTWLPTFNNKVLHLNQTMSIEIASILSATYALGRLTAGVLLKKIHWLNLLIVCIAVSGLMILLLLPHGHHPRSTLIALWKDAPWKAYIFPLVGFFLAPIYPTLCSTVLSALPKNRHSAMMGLIMIFSALGGTLGSKLTGVEFGRLGGHYALSLSLIPLALLFLLLFFYHRQRKEQLSGVLE